MCISDVAPISNFVDTSSILADHCVADISKLAVLKDEEVVLVSNLLKLCGNAVIPPGTAEETNYA